MCQVLSRGAGSTFPAVSEAQSRMKAEGRQALERFLQVVACQESIVGRRRDGREERLDPPRGVPGGTVATAEIERGEDDSGLQSHAQHGKGALLPHEFDAGAQHSGHRLPVLGRRREGQEDDGRQRKCE